MWILPTRSRPDNCQRLVKHWKETKSSTPVLVRLDHCDPFLKELLKIEWPDTFIISVGEREGVAKATNEVFLKYPNESWYGFLADDFIPRTEFWDLRLIEAAGTNKCAYPNDLAGKKASLPTLPCVGGDLVRAVGWFGFPYTHHYYVDTIWKFVGKELKNIVRLEDVIVEHMHPVYGKSEVDIVYKESKEKAGTDKEKYNQWMADHSTTFINNLKNKGFYCG